MRPLPYQPDVSEAKITRKHLLPRDEHLRNLVSVVGGKLTTHRKVAPDALDVVDEILDRSADCRTARQSLPGGRTDDWQRFADGFRASCDLPPEVTQHLLQVYGTRATEISRLGRGATTGRVGERVPPAREAIGGMTRSSAL